MVYLPNPQVNSTLNPGLQVYPFSCALNPDLPIPCTVDGDRFGASALKDLLDSEDHDKPIERATYILASYGLRIQEIDEYADNLRPEFTQFVADQQQASKAWPTAKPHEQHEMLERFRERAVKKLSTHGWELAHDIALLSHEPIDLTPALSALSLLGDDPDLWWAYFYGLGDAPHVLRVEPDKRYRARFEYLVTLGLAKRGLNIGVARLVASLSLRDLNALVFDLIDKKVRKQVRAASIAIMAPDLPDRLRRQLPHLDDLFWTEPPPGVPLEAFLDTMGYLRATAELLWSTYFSGARTRKKVDEFDYGDPERRWRIRTSECCADCKEHATGWEEELPDSLPPFHVGCGCDLEMK